VDGFKKIRLLIIKEALTEFEICINNNLQELGLHDWKIRLDVDRETKSKTIQKGFHVFIESPTKKEYVPFECYCGGERGRLKLAGVLGLIDFINNRKGSGCDIEIFDEPTTHLSVEGESDLIDILARRSREYGKKIFFIDHKDLGSCGEFDGIIEVMKDKNGSYIK
jgi:DNA repair exonuclease SbcCD ATPase subunit